MRQRALTLALRHVLLGLLVALLATPLQSCVNTPTLPLPPPVASVGAPNLQGLVRVEGQANEEAYVIVLNENTDLGEISRANLEGRFSIEIAASAGDLLVIWQESDGVSGEHTEQTVPAPMP